MGELPKALEWTDRWAIRITAIVFGLLVGGNLLVNQHSAWLPSFVLALIMGPVAYWMLRGLLRFQRVNAAFITARVFRGFVWFFWGFGAFIVGLAAVSVVSWPVSAITWAFGAFMGVGLCLAAARSWRDGELFAKHEPEHGKTAPQ